MIMTWIYCITGLSIFIIYTWKIYAIGIRRGMKMGHEITMEAMEDLMNKEKKNPSPVSPEKHFEHFRRRF